MTSTGSGWGYIVLTWGNAANPHKDAFFQTEESAIGAAKSLEASTGIPTRIAEAFRYSNNSIKRGGPTMRVWDDLKQPEGCSRVD
jgi:hypothetical protein